MTYKANIHFRRYLDAKQFSSELKKLKAFRGRYVGDGLLEELDQLNLVRPALRLWWPDLVARRLWLESDRHSDALIVDIEPDGPRWDAAADLYNALQSTNTGPVHDDTPHPFDDPKAEWRQFLQLPAQQSFQLHRDRRVSVANERYPELFDSGNIKDFYSSWQILLAAEVADIGVRIRLNMADDTISDKVCSDLRDGRLPKEGRVSGLFDPSRAVHSFSEHRLALDAIVWSVEEGEIGLLRLLKGSGGGRAFLTKDQAEVYEAVQAKTANEACRRYCVAAPEVLACCKFLARKWSDWESEGRPFVADAYKTFLASGIQLLQRTEGWELSEISERVGSQSGYFKPTLEVIWPNWEAEQIERLTRTLNGSGLSADQLAAFGQFLVDNFMDAVFLRLRSFEIHAFEGADSPLAGMKSDLQGMAVAVEQAVRAMGGNDAQLHKMFRSLWDGTEVAGILRQNKTLFEQGRVPEEILDDIDRLRTQSGAAKDAADLILAARVRGAVHHALTIDDQLLLEQLFVRVLRAAAITHAQVFGSNSDSAEGIQG